MTLAMEKQEYDFSLSIVSHGQAALIRHLLADLAQLKPRGIKQIIVTINVPENEDLFGPEISIADHVIRNATPKGFGANHNAAFHVSTGKSFVIVNPDIRLSEIDFDGFSSVLQRSKVGACAPVVLSSSGSLEDSFRRFPTVWSLFCKVVFRRRKPGYELAAQPFAVDWVAGMFVAFNSLIFKELGGFDERYFMYYEDADICRRMNTAGYEIVVQPLVQVIHDAQRDSSRKLRYLLWHVRSIIRFISGI